MAYSAVPTRDTDDTNSFADINQLQDNIDYLYDRTPVQENHFIYGLEISNDTDADHDIQVAVGSAIDSTFALKLELSSAITKQIDAAWAVGDNAGGLDTGSVAADTWYYIWLIKKDSDGTIDALFSLSATTPTMPSGYTYKRRVRGAILTNGSADILGFQQYEDTFIFNTRQADFGNNSPGTSKANATMSVPPILCEGIFNAFMYNGAVFYANYFGYNETDRVPSLTDCDQQCEAGNQDNMEFRRLCYNSVLGYRASTSPVTDWNIWTLGFIDKGAI